MKIDLSKKKALVGGSSKGIGLGIARQLAESGASVCLMARDKNKLEKINEISKRSILLLPLTFSYNYIRSYLQNIETNRLFCSIYPGLIKLRKEFRMVLDALDFLQSAYSIVQRTLQSYRRLNARLIITLAVTLSQGVLCKSFVKKCFS